MPRLDPLDAILYRFGWMLSEQTFIFYTFLTLFFFCSFSLTLNRFSLLPFFPLNYLCLLFWILCRLFTHHCINRVADRLIRCVFHVFFFSQLSKPIDIFFQVFSHHFHRPIVLSLFFFCFTQSQMHKTIHALGYNIRLPHQTIYYQIEISSYHLRLTTIWPHRGCSKEYNTRNNISKELIPEINR